jgi:hypothetical protein
LPAAGGDATGLEEWENGDDLGTGEFATKSEGELMTLLAWPQGRPPIFAKYQSIHGWTEWDDDYVQEFEEDNALINLEMKLLKLLWHQLVGVSSILSKLWTAYNGHVPGMLLADTVGLGKTTQIMGTIAGIIQVWKGEQIQPPARPQLLREYLLLSRLKGRNRKPRAARHSCAFVLASSEYRMEALLGLMLMYLVYSPICSQSEIVLRQRPSAGSSARNCCANNFN